MFRFISTDVLHYPVCTFKNLRLSRNETEFNTNRVRLAASDKLRNVHRRIHKVLLRAQNFRIFPHETKHKTIFLFFISRLLSLSFSPRFALVRNSHDIVTFSSFSCSFCARSSTILCLTLFAMLSTP